MALSKHTNESEAPSYSFWQTKVDMKENSAILVSISSQPTRMKLNLKKPLIVFDLETTGLDLVKDRIIQMSYIKVNTDGSEVRKNLYVNPGKTIPQEVVELTGISNEDVKDAPTFKELAPTLNQDFSGCDFAGYNSNHFDVPTIRRYDGMFIIFSRFAAFLSALACSLARAASRF